VTAGYFSASVVQLNASQNPATTRVSAAPVSSPDRDVLDKYCVNCHNQKLRTAGLALDSLNVNDVGVDAATWEKVVRKLRSGAMPPVGRPRPDHATYAAVSSHLEEKLDAAASKTLEP